MRTSTLLALSLSTAATLVNAKSNEEGGGAIEALLERMQKTKQEHQHDRRAMNGRYEAPSDYYSHDLEEEDGKNSTSSHARSHSTKTRLSHSSSVESESASSTTTRSKFVKSTDRPSRHHHIRPSNSTSSASSVSKSRLRSTDSPRRPFSNKEEDLPTSPLEKKLRAAELEQLGEDDEEEIEDSETVQKSSKKEKSFGKKYDEEKRWVWATQILQDDTPVASGIPAPGENANLLNTIPVNTPSPAALVAPSLPPLSVAVAQPSSSSLTTPPAVSSTTPAAVSSSTTTSRAVRQVIANRKKPAEAAATSKSAVAKEKRYIWSGEIIQDGDESAPEVGESANLLSSGTTIALTTPAAQLTPPSFPPLADATSSSLPSIETPIVSQSNSGPEAASQVIESASSTLSAVASQMTSPALAGSIGALLAQLQSQLDALASAYAQTSASTEEVAAAGETSPVDNAKRWVWGPSIIQDDSPVSEVPAVGQNTNLFSSAIPVATPTNKPLAPDFAGRTGLAPVVVVPSSVSLAVESSSVVVAQQPPAVTPLANVLVDSVSSKPVPTPSSSSSVHRNRKSEGDSIRSVRAAASKNAALEWHKVQQKRKLGGMAKQHKRQ
ncbi:uncharacterized protein JCM6883_005340 [Sporobolomyces salmoneus]|uniref:uncharacterized protein n=1 Tax=Sporobolomyces salmoneus TaxID=183962 RepID=UPI0031717937